MFILFSLMLAIFQARMQLTPPKLAQVFTLTNGTVYMGGVIPLASDISVAMDWENYGVEGVFLFRRVD
jgi:hypothetical protein